MKKLALFAFSLFAVFLAGCLEQEPPPEELDRCNLGDGYDVSCVRNVAIENLDADLCTRVFRRGSVAESTCIMDYARIVGIESACERIAQPEIVQVCKNRI